MKSWRVVAVVVALALAPCVPAAAAKGKKRRPQPTPTATPGPAPTPTPALLRAAGACLSFEPGHFILLAEVGQQGRMFRIGPETVFHVEPRRGARIRLIYQETADGPLAREVLPGPSPYK